MKKKYKNLEFSLSYYQYSDHATNATLVIIDHVGCNHSYIKIDLTDDERRKVWYAAVTKGKEAGRAEIKRIYRKRLQKAEQYKVYSFWLEGNRDFIRLKTANVRASAPIADRLVLWKRQKEAFADDGWVYTGPAVTKVELGIVDNQFQMMKKEPCEDNTQKVLKESQFCITLFSPSVWDNIRKLKMIEK